MINEKNVDRTKPQYKHQYPQPHKHANQSEAAREPGQRPLLAFKAHRHAAGPFSNGLLALCMDHHMARLLAFTCSTPKQHPHKKTLRRRTVP